MKLRFAGGLIYSFLTFLPFTVFSQQDSLKLPIDSTFLPRIVTSGYFAEQSLVEYGTYGARVSDPDLSHAYAGVSVLNTLRGEVPSLSISPSVVNPGGAAFRGTALFCIDGMPFDANVSSYYNLSAFDFESITVIANPNTGFSYGSAGLQGGFFLRSKTGENKVRPSFEFNSYTSRNLSYKEPIYREPAHSAWNFSNSFAYSQDYGAVDLRVSYNLNNNPFPPDSNVDGNNSAHSFKFNGGLDLGKFSLRFIGDYRTENWNSESNLPSPRTDEGYAHFLQGNLFAQYKFNDMLKITSQHISSSTDVDSYNEFGLGYADLYSEQPRRLHNAIVSFDKPITAQFRLSSFAGVQFDEFRWTRTASEGTTKSEQHWEIKNTGLFAGAGLRFAETLFLDFSYRNDAFSLFVDNESADTWGASASFVFSKLFERDELFFGKLRSYVGRTNNDYHLTYPQLAQLMTLFPTPPSPRKNFEIGADLAFARNRITFSTSYYKNVQDDLWTYIFSPFIGGPQLLNLGELNYSGYEFVAGFLPIATTNARLSSRITFFKNDNEIESDFERDDGDPFLGHQTANWQASWFNQFSYRAVFLNVLIDVRNGGDVYLFDHMATPLGSVNGSYTKFRDITLGYDFGQTLVHRLNLASARISISGRNLIQLNDKDDDAERYNFYDHLKSLSVSLSIGF